jgi:hypothetical protein
MDRIGLIVLLLLVAVAVILIRQRRRDRLSITHHDVLCPEYGCRAEIAVQTDPGAQSCAQHVEVATCSLFSDAAYSLPERTGYLPDAPAWRVRLDPPRATPVAAAGVPCRQSCLFVLNRTAVAGAAQAVPDTPLMGSSMELARQAVDNPRMSRLFWYSL